MITLDAKEIKRLKLIIDEIDKCQNSPEFYFSREDIIEELLAYDDIMLLAKIGADHLQSINKPRKPRKRKLVQQERRLDIDL